jgi:ribonuclease-3
MNSSLETRLAYGFVNGELLTLALTHRSFANEISAGASTTGLDNERLEFLGDAVLDLTLSDLLMRTFPHDNEGALSRKRASLVNEEVLAKIAVELKVEELLRLGKGEAKTGGVFKPRILASGLEAVIGAVFQDGGFTAVERVTEVLFGSRVTDLANSDVDFRDDYKTRLQEKLQEKHRATPTYRIEAESGPDHDKQFRVSVRLSEDVLGFGEGKSKKAAEQNAAREVLEKMQ